MSVDSSARRARTRAARLVAERHGVNYTAALRTLTHPLEAAQPLSAEPQGWYKNRPVKAWPQIAVLTQGEAGGADRLEIRDRVTDAVLASSTAPHLPAETLVTAAANEGMWPDRQARPGSPADWMDLLRFALNFPGERVHQLGYTTLGEHDWLLWDDGTWRAPARQAKTKFSVLVEPVAGQPLLRLAVTEHPGGWVHGETTVPSFEFAERWRTVGRNDALNAALAELGFVHTSPSQLWDRMTGGRIWAECRPGQLAERTWYLLAKVRVTRQYHAGAPADYHGHIYRVGELLTANQHGYPGSPVEHESWWVGEGADADYGHILPSTHVEVVEILRDVPPRWSEAAIDQAEQLSLLEDYFPNAAEAVGAWHLARLVVADSRSGLQIFTPGPEHRLVGELDRDYWDGNGGRLNRYTKAYRAVVAPQERWRDRKLNGLPLDPVAAAAPS